MNRKSLFYRLAYYDAWRIVGAFMLLVAVTQFLRESYLAGFSSVIMGITYLFLIPLNLLASFRLGYSCGTGDTLAYGITNGQAPMTRDPHPRDAIAELDRRWDEMMKRDED